MSAQTNVTVGLKWAINPSVLLEPSAPQQPPKSSLLRKQIYANSTHYPTCQ